MIKIRHLGDITKIDGSTAPIVDIVTFGAPCQDLSVAGKRAGMKHEAVGDDETTRSGLFFEAIRIIKEMREHDRQLRMQGADDIGRPLRPRYTVYENVPGAFSSNKGEDFRAVLEETVKVADKDAVIPRPEGKWPPCGRIVAEYDRPTEMASLFDGIGGFPLAFSRHGCTPVWASEIEEFPMAVTKIRFPE